jgi:hypothetical protein
MVGGTYFFYETINSESYVKVILSPFFNQLAVEEK